MRRLQDFITHFTHPGSANTTGSSRSGNSGTKSGAGPNFCCKISPWLALGCLSPRQLYEQLQQRLSGQPQQLRAAGQGTDTGEGRAFVLGLQEASNSVFTPPCKSSGLCGLSQQPPSCGLKARLLAFGFQML